MAGEADKKQKKATISQEDVYDVLQRYSATTVITLLKEVSQAADMKIDWNELVKKTTTGISNAREYQMLWRHLAYRDTLDENIDEGALPKDDDSDLEFELEADPPVSGDATTEAAAYAKVMLASASLTDATASSVVEAPLAINVPSGWSSSSSTENPKLLETEMIVPVLVPKQSATLSRVSSVEALDTVDTADAKQPLKKKRRAWTKQEDEELTAAVRKYGEGNWINMVKGKFKDDRTDYQLSQRWTFLKKRKESSSRRDAPQPADLSAVRRAFNMALDMPFRDNSRSTFFNVKGGTLSNPKTTTSSSMLLGSHSQHLHQQNPNPLASSKSQFMSSAERSTSAATLGPDDMVKAAAVAAGARIATPSDAAALIKAAHSKNAVHIIPSGSSSMKLSRPSNLKSLPPNVHFLNSGLVRKPTSGSGHNNIVNSSSSPARTQQGSNTEIGKEETQQ